MKQRSGFLPNLIERFCRAEKLIKQKQTMRRESTRRFLYGSVKTDLKEVRLIVAKKSFRFMNYLIVSIMMTLAPLAGIGPFVKAAETVCPANASAGNYPFWCYNGPGSNASGSTWCQPSGCTYDSNGTLMGWASEQFRHGYRNCTDWVSWRLYSRDGYNTGRYGSWGHGYQWKTKAAGLMIEYSQTPARGAIAHWGQSSTRPWGHVAYVEDYNASTNTVKTSEYNGRVVGGHAEVPYNLNETGNGRPDGYIRVDLGSSGALSGSWLTLTPSDLSLFRPGQLINLNARGNASGAGGLSKINITSDTPNRDWGIVKTQNYPLNTTSGDISASVIMPDEPYLLVSFDVYAHQDGVYRKAPGGVRKYCNAYHTSTCVHVEGEGGGSPFGLGGTACTTPPTTSASVNGDTPGNQGWWRSAVSVALSSVAPCGDSGAQTFYSINGGSRNTYSAPFAINQEGRHNVSFYSVDAIGNTEASKSIEVKIDWTPPVTTGNATGPRDTNGIFRDNVTIGLNSTDNLSGVDFQQYTLDGGTNWKTLSGASNSFVLDGNGVSRVLYRATDVAGNNEQNRDSGPIIINKYVVFSNGTGSSLKFTAGTGVNIAGDIHSNGSTSIQWNTGSSLGTTYRTVATPNVISGNTDTRIPAITTGVPKVPMLAYPLSLYKSLATVYFPSDLKLDSVNTRLKNTIYVDGNVDMRDVGLNGPVSIIATGSITDYTTDSSFQTSDPYNGVLLYAGKDINVNSTGNRNLGLIYAPNGTVNVRATNLALKGSLVGNQVSVAGATTFNLSYDPAFASSSHALPLTAMGLELPTTTPVPLPVVPSLYRPAAGSTLSSTGVRFGWSSSTGAIGYQLQVSKSSSFSTLDYNASQLSSGQKMNLSPATTYYWRVRAINQAGITNWSPVGSFRTM